MNNDIISVQLVFDRYTEFGPIQAGDFFFGFTTSYEFTNQNSESKKEVFRFWIKQERFLLGKLAAGSSNKI